MVTAIEAGREKYRAKISSMQANWRTFAQNASGAAYSAGLVAAGLSGVATSIVSNWTTGVKAGIDKYISKVTAAAADKWYTNYTKKMTTGAK